MPKEIQDKDKYVERIQQLVPLNELSPQLQKEIIHVAQINHYKKREFIFRQGDRDEYSFYNLEGDVELLVGKEVKNIINSDSDSSHYAMSRLQPRQFSARAKTDAVILQLDRAALDRLMVLENENSFDLSGTSEVYVSEIDEEDSADWMTKMLQSQLFCRLPTANIQQLFAVLEPLELNAGDTVIRQGEIGEYYYIIREGRCEVSRVPKDGAKPITLSELRSGDSFGEEALLTEAKRNVTITMLTDGVLMQLSKENFINIIKKSTLYAVGFEDGRKLVDGEGAFWLDVRFPNEYEESRIEGSINIPLNNLRTQADKLRRDKKYVIYCDSGGRSSVAAFLLTDLNMDVVYLAEGMSSVPQTARGENLSVVTEKQESVARRETQQESPENTGQNLTTELPEEIKNKGDDFNEMGPDIRASVIEANLGRTTLELEKANYKAEEERARAEFKAEQARLEAEKKRLEEQKKAVQEEARKLREEETRKIEKMRQEAEKRMADEKKKLEQVYSRNTKEMEKLERIKKEAEEHIRKERDKLEKDTLKAREKLQEADKLKLHIEKLRATFEKESEKRRSEQEALEKDIQTKTRGKLEQERRKLAEEIARANEEMAFAQRERASADAARKAAEEEAKEIIAEYKQQFEKEREAEKQRLDEERKKLKQEEDKIQAKLTDIQKSKMEAEEARQQAELEAQKLREKQAELEALKDKRAQEAIAEEVRLAEEKLEQATLNVENVQQEEVTAEVAMEVNEQELQRQKEEEERMKKQVAEDLEQFMNEQKEQLESSDKLAAHANHVKRIKDRAEAAKRAAAEATDNLFADIASQLGRND